MAEEEDSALVRRTLRGELVAFETLVERHREAVFGVAARIVGRQDAEDVAQDAFLRAFHSLPRYRGDAPFRAWLLRIARNTALHAVERRRPVPIGDPADGAEPVGAATAERTPADSLDVSERRARMRVKLRGLSPANRSVLVLRDLEGLSYDEVAEALDMPLGSVKGRLHRARSELADALRRNTYAWGLPDER